MSDELTREQVENLCSHILGHASIEERLLAHDAAMRQKCAELEDSVKTLTENNAYLAADRNGYKQQLATVTQERDEWKSWAETGYNKHIGGLCEDIVDLKAQLATVTQERKHLQERLNELQAHIERHP